MLLQQTSQDARVRYAGFGKDEDEWVNVARGVRDRSIPLESSECYRVKVGDLVLCFRVTLCYSLFIIIILMIYEKEKKCRRNKNHRREMDPSTLTPHTKSLKT